LQDSDKNNSGNQYSESEICLKIEFKSTHVRYLWLAFLKRRRLKKQFFFFFFHRCFLPYPSRLIGFGHVVSKTNMRYRATVDVDVIFLLNRCGQSENCFIFSFVSTLRQSRFSLLITA
jgi:hypothetical protein